MSETEHYTGKITPTGLTVDQFMRDVEISKYCDTKKEHFEECMNDEAIEIDGLVFTIASEKHDAYEDIMNASKNDDGSYDFEVKYYNGGCGFSEAIEDALKAIS